jgi:hypothetical protein
MSSTRKEQRKETETEAVEERTSSSLQVQQEQQQHYINKALDETRENIRKSTDEARREIPRYTQAVNDYQEQTIQASRELADDYIESQKQIIHSYQSTLVPQIENIYRMFWNNWVSPRTITEVYARAVSSIADNTIAATRLTNNTIFANMEAFKTSIQHAKDNAKELSRIGLNTAKTLEQASRDNATERKYYYSAQTTT